MSTSSGSTTDQSDYRSRDRSCGYWGSKGNWSGINIAAMVLGFVIFWPIGLFILYWIVTGRSVSEIPRKMRNQWSKLTRKSEFNGNHTTDNTVFNEFQQTQYDRIREIKDEIKERSRRFSEFRENAKRRADEEEFNRFMSEAPVRNDG